MSARATPSPRNSLSERLSRSRRHRHWAKSNDGTSVTSGTGDSVQSPDDQQQVSAANQRMQEKATALGATNSTANTANAPPASATPPPQAATGRESLSQRRQRALQLSRNRNRNAGATPTTPTSKPAAPSPVATPVVSSPPPPLPPKPPVTPVTPSTTLGGNVTSRQQQHHQPQHQQQPEVQQPPPPPKQQHTPQQMAKPSARSPFPATTPSSAVTSALYGRRKQPNIQSSTDSNSIGSGNGSNDGSYNRPTHSRPPVKMPPASTSGLMWPQEKKKESPCESQQYQEAMLAEDQDYNSNDYDQDDSNSDSADDDRLSVPDLKSSQATSRVNESGNNGMGASGNTYKSNKPSWMPNAQSNYVASATTSEPPPPSTSPVVPASPSVPTPKQYGASQHNHVSPAPSSSTTPSYKFKQQQQQQQQQRSPMPVTASPAPSAQQRFQQQSPIPPVPASPAPSVQNRFRQPQPQQSPMPPVPASPAPSVQNRFKQQQQSPMPTVPASPLPSVQNRFRQQYNQQSPMPSVPASPVPSVQNRFKQQQQQPQPSPMPPVPASPAPSVQSRFKQQHQPQQSPMPPVPASPAPSVQNRFKQQYNQASPMPLVPASPAPSVQNRFKQQQQNIDPNPPAPATSNKPARYSAGGAPMASSSYRSSSSNNQTQGSVTEGYNSEEEQQQDEEHLDDLVASVISAGHGNAVIETPKKIDFASLRASFGNKNSRSGAASPPPMPMNSRSPQPRRSFSQVPSSVKSNTMAVESEEIEQSPSNQDDSYESQTSPPHYAAPKKPSWKQNQRQSSTSSSINESDSASANGILRNNSRSSQSNSPVPPSSSQRAASSSPIPMASGDGQNRAWKNQQQQHQSHPQNQQQQPQQQTNNIANRVTWKAPQILELSSSGSQVGAATGPVAVPGQSLRDTWEKRTHKPVKEEPVEDETVSKHKFWEQKTKPTPKTWSRPKSIGGGSGGTPTRKPQQRHSTPQSLRHRGMEQQEQHAGMNPEEFEQEQYESSSQFSGANLDVQEQNPSSPPHHINARGASNTNSRSQYQGNPNQQQQPRSWQAKREQSPVVTGPVVLPTSKPLVSRPLVQASPPPKMKKRSEVQLQSVATVRKQEVPRPAQKGSSLLSYWKSRSEGQSAPLPEELQHSLQQDGMEGRGPDDEAFDAPQQYQHGSAGRDLRGAPRSQSHQYAPPAQHQHAPTAVSHERPSPRPVPAGPIVLPSTRSYESVTHRPEPAIEKSAPAPSPKAAPPPFILPSSKGYQTSRPVPSFDEPQFLQTEPKPVDEEPFIDNDEEDLGGPYSTEADDFYDNDIDHDAPDLQTDIEELYQQEAGVSDGAHGWDNGMGKPPAGNPPVKYSPWQNSGQGAGSAVVDPRENVIEEKKSTDEYNQNVSNNASMGSDEIYYDGSKGIQTKPINSMESNDSEVYFDGPGSETQHGNSDDHKDISRMATDSTLIADIDEAKKHERRTMTGETDDESYVSKESPGGNMSSLPTDLPPDLEKKMEEPSPGRPSPPKGLLQPHFVDDESVEEDLLPPPVAQDHTDSEEKKLPRLTPSRKDNEVYRAIYYGDETPDSIRRRGRRSSSPIHGERLLPSPMQDEDGAEPNYLNPALRMDEIEHAAREFMDDHDGPSNGDEQNQYTTPERRSFVPTDQMMKNLEFEPRTYEDPELHEMQSDVDSDVVFGNPRTYGLAGDPEAGGKSPSVRERSHAIEGWKPGHPPASPDLGGAHRDRHLLPPLTPSDRQNPKSKATRVLSYWGDGAPEGSSEFDDADEWVDRDPDLVDFSERDASPTPEPKAVVNVHPGNHHDLQMMLDSDTSGVGFGKVAPPAEASIEGGFDQQQPRHPHLQMQPPRHQPSQMRQPRHQPSHQRIPGNDEISASSRNWMAAQETSFVSNKSSKSKSKRGKTVFDPFGDDGPELATASNGSDDMFDDTGGSFFPQEAFSPLNWSTPRGTDMTPQHSKQQGNEFRYSPALESPNRMEI